MPKRVLTFVSQFAHLTIVSHELTSGYFACAILRDCGLLKAYAGSGNDWLELYFVVATSVALFVAFVFWGSALIDPALMAPVDVILPPRIQLCPDFKQHLLFGAMFGPTDPEPDCRWQTPFRLFMQYIHTLCPLLLVIDMMLVQHSLGPADMEINATLCFAWCYLSWNLFCWWLLQTPPYPLQKRFFELGVPWAVFAYAVLSIFAMSLCIYTRWVRTVGEPQVAPEDSRPSLFYCIPSLVDCFMMASRDCDTLWTRMTPAGRRPTYLAMEFQPPWERGPKNGTKGPKRGWKSAKKVLRDPDGDFKMVKTEKGWMKIPMSESSAKYIK
eukprot:symbB.v1.2.028557.t1/scaffold3038.1/size64864/2